MTKMEVIDAKIAGWIGDMDHSDLTGIWNKTMLNRVDDKVWRAFKEKYYDFHYLAEHFQDIEKAETRIILLTTMKFIACEMMGFVECLTALDILDCADIYNFESDTMSVIEFIERD